MPHSFAPLSGPIHMPGIEPSRVWARMARQNGVDVLESMIQDTPEVRAMFAQSDIVLSNHSMEHHWDPRLLLSLARDTIEPDSILSITFLNAESTFWLFQSLFLLHLDVYTVRSLESLLASYRFRCFYKSQRRAARPASRPAPASSTTPGSGPCSANPCVNWLWPGFCHWLPRLAPIFSLRLRSLSAERACGRHLLHCRTTGTGRGAKRDLGF